MKDPAFRVGKDFASSGEQVGECVGERIMKGLVGQVKGFIVISPEGPR